jgi:ribosomal protein L11 methyltransferase
MDLVEVRADIPVGAVDAIDELLLEHGAASWSVNHDILSQRASLVGIFPSEAEAIAGWYKIEPLLDAAGIIGGAVPAIRTLGDKEWRDSYKSHFKAWSFEKLHWVPVWQRDTFKLSPGDSVLWLDPGMAFGTGNHETTRLCCERLVVIAQETGLLSPDSRQKGAPPAKGVSLRVVDAGCGSGILALSAALLGFRDVVGFDNDPDAVRVSDENAVANGLAGRVRFFVAGLDDGLKGRQADVLLANIQADVLVRFGRELVDAVAPGGWLVLSGILANENSATRVSFEKLCPGWTINARVMGEWSDIVLRRPA